MKKPKRKTPDASSTLSSSNEKAKAIATIAKRKLQITEARRELRERTWRPIALRLRDFIRRGGLGTQSAIARRVGCEPSQIHRYTCPVCEHDAEPTYSTGKAFEEILEKWEHVPKIFVAIWNGKEMPSLRKKVSSSRRRGLPKLRRNQLTKTKQTKQTKQTKP